MLAWLAPGRSDAGSPSTDQLDNRRLSIVLDVLVAVRQSVLMGNRQVLVGSAGSDLVAHGEVEQQRFVYIGPYAGCNKPLEHICDSADSSRQRILMGSDVLAQHVLRLVIRRYQNNSLCPSATLRPFLLLPFFTPFSCSPSLTSSAYRSWLSSSSRSSTSRRAASLIV